MTVHVCEKLCGDDHQVVKAAACQQLMHCLVLLNSCLQLEQVLQAKPWTAPPCGAER